MKKGISLLCLICFGLVYGQKTWSLKECVDYAIAHNLTVNQSQIQEEFDKNNLKNSQNQWLPSVSGYFDNSLSLGTNHPALNKGYQQFSNSMGVNSSITIYQGGLLDLNKDKAALQVESGKFQTESVINDISLQVVNYYLNIMLNRELLQIAQGNLELSESQLDRSQKLFENGRIAKADVVQSEASVAQERKNVSDAEIEVERALFNLSVLLQLPDYRDFQVEIIQIPDTITLGLYDLNEILQIAYNQQPTIKRAEVEYEVAEKEIEIAKTGFLPTVTGSYNFGTSYSDFFNKGLVNDAWLNQWYDNIVNVVGVNVRIPIFEKFNNKLNVERAQINQTLAQNSIDQQKQNIRENVQEAYFNAYSSFQAYEFAKESVRSNEISADFAQRSFDAGVLNIYDLNTANNNLAIAKSQMAQAKFNFIFRIKVLDFYAGLPLTVGYL